MNALLLSALFFAPMGVCADGLALRERLLAPHPSGPVGLFRTLSAERQPPGPLAFGQSVTTTYFHLNDFPNSGEQTERLAGKAALSYTPLSFAELFVAGAALTSNDDASAELIQQMGNLDFGVKLGFDLNSSVSIAPTFFGHYQRAVADLDFVDNAFSYDGLLAATWNLRPRLPLRVHGNIGFRWDGTDNLAIGPITERQMVILGVVGKNSIVGAVGVEFPISPVVLSLEYSTEQTLDSPGAGYIDNPQRVTAGIRYFPTIDHALSLETAADLGFFAADSASRVVREPDYQLYFGMTYLFGTAGEQRELKSVESVAAAPKVAVFGRVTDAKTGQPIGQARIDFCREGVSAIASDVQTGKYRSYSLPEGPCQVRVKADAYEEIAAVLQVPGGGELESNFSMTPTEPSRGMLVVQVRAKDGKPRKATIILPDLPQAKPMETNDQGGLRIGVPIGDYRVQAQADGLKADSISVNVIEGRQSFVELILQPEVESVRLEKTQIVVLRPIEFKWGSADLIPASMTILRSVADILRAHAEITKLEVAGHTDSSGTREANMLISQKRAEAVQNYLVSLGIEPPRLSAVGYGPDKPLADNKSRQGRATNRRVEFNIVDK